MKNIDKLLQEERNKRSHELFNKDECYLQSTVASKLWISRRISKVKTSTTIPLDK